MRPRTLLLFAFAAPLGAVAAALPALAAPSEVKLEVNENCNGFTNWPCWTQPGGSPKYAEVITIASGGKLTFADKTTVTTDVVWTAGSPPPVCTGVPNTPTSSWEGSCKFEQSGTYRFESANLFKGTYYGHNEDYTKYEVVVAGPPTPTATTEQATGVTENKATLSGSVNPEGQATTYYFNYGTTTGYGSKTKEEPAGSGKTSQEVHATLTGLSPNTTYYFQLVAVYGAGKTKVEGGSMTFKTTAPPGAPTASTQQATGVTETEATLKGAVNPDGEATKYFFKWGTTTGYGQTTSLQPAGEDHASHAVSAVLKGLAPGTTYHFQIVAENKSGTAPGGDETFTTASTPAKEPQAKEPSPTPTPTPTHGPISPEPELAPLVEGSLKLTPPHHGSSLRGSIQVSSSGAGGRLEVELLANSASLAKIRHKRSTSTVVGRLVRASVPAGKMFFSISLNARAKSALHRHHKLALTVQIVLTPVAGAPASVTRSVVLRG